MASAGNGRSSIRFILYDLDGTLVDTVPLGIELFKAAAEHLSQAIPSSNDLRKWWGHSTEEIVQEFWPKLKPADFSAVVRELAISARAFDPIPGATDTVKQIRLAGKLDGIYTNRRRGDGLRTILAAIGLPQESWVHLYSPDISGFSKSNPRVLESILFKLADLHGVSTREVLLVGDTLLDARIAHINDISFVGVMTGAASAEDFEGEGVQLENVLPSVVDLPTWLHLPQPSAQGTNISH